MLNQFQTLTIKILNNLISNFTYYLIFQLLFNLLFIYIEVNPINKKTGANFLEYYFSLVIMGVYIFPMMFLTFLFLPISFIIRQTGYSSDFLFSISLILSTIILCNIPPFANKFKKLFKIKNHKLEIILNVILVILVVYTCSKLGIFTKNPE